MDRGRLPDPSRKLTGNGDRGDPIEFDEFGMSKDKAGAEAESDQRNQGDSIQTMVRHEHLVAFGID